jgi:hypothetical protein
MVRGKAAGRISDDVGAGAMDLSRNGVVAELAGSVPGHYEGV